MPPSIDRRLRRLATVVFLITLAFAAYGGAVANAETTGVTIPHLSQNADTDVCAMCHRAHTSAGTVEWAATHTTPAGSLTTTHSALTVGTPQISGDTGLCFSCHGVGSLGSGEDVQTPFSNESSHALEPQIVPFGLTTTIQCSTCHDSHGAARDASGNVYAALLRAGTATDMVYQGDQYCATCHKGDRAASEFDGLTVYKTTPHATEIAPPQSGTGITCSACHEPHGSPLPALVRTTVTPPSAPDTVTVTGDDRTQCFACHSAADATWPGATGYTSSHASTPKSVAIDAEWANQYGKASQVATRAVGECENCHDPMGRDDGTGVALPKLVNRPGSTLCYRCHTSSGPAATDFDSLAYRHSPLDRQVVVGWAPNDRTADYGRVAVWTADASSTPGAIIGPREYRPSGTTGALATGDVNGDGRDEVVAAERGTAAIDILATDPFTGLKQVTASGLTIGGPAEYIAVGRFVNDGAGRAQIAVVDSTAGLLRLYEFNGTSLSQIGTDLPVGNGASGVAVGDVTGTTSQDLVVTAATDDQFRIFSESSGALVANGPYGTSAGPRGPSIGPVLDGTAANGIVIANGGVSGGVGGISIFRGDGTKVGDLDTTPASLAPRATAVGDILPAAPGAEIGVALDGATGSDGYVDVFSRPSGGGAYGSPQAIKIATDAHPSAIAVGDPDGDGEAELVVANAGLWDPSATGMDASVSVLQRDTVNGSSIDNALTKQLWAGGRELAGGIPTLAIADLGAVGPSRHPMDAGAASHDSTEVGSPTPLARHVVCTDCHNVHTATDAVATAPVVPGPIVGTWGVAVTNNSVSSITYTEQRGIQYEYQLCFKCHSPWADLRGGRNVAAEFNTNNASVHAVESSTTNSAVPDGTWTPGKSLSNTTLLYCIDCHGDSVSSQAPGPHRSNDAPLLVSPLLGVRATDTSGFCYGCHLKAVYSDGASPASLFSNGTTSEHALHVGTGGFSCTDCHVSHGSSANRALLRDDIGWVAASNGGSCANSCHTSGASHAYTR